MSIARNVLNYNLPHTFSSGIMQQHRSSKSVLLFIRAAVIFKICDNRVFSFDYIEKSKTPLKMLSAMKIRWTMFLKPKKAEQRKP